MCTLIASGKCWLKYSKIDGSSLSWTNRKCTPSDLISISMDSILILFILFFFVFNFKEKNFLAAYSNTKSIMFHTQLNWYINELKSWTFFFGWNKQKSVRLETHAKTYLFSKSVWRRKITLNNKCLRNCYLHVANA